MPRKEPAENAIDTPIRAPRGMSRATLEAVRSMGIQTVKDLFFYFPARYDEYAPVGRIADVGEGIDNLIELELVSVRPIRAFRRRMSMTEARFSDGTDSITALWFNQPYLAKTLVPGERYRLAGKVKHTKFGPRFVSPLYVRADAEEKDEVAGALMPVYPLVAGVSLHAIRRLMRLHRPYLSGIVDPLPMDLRERLDLAELRGAVEAAHFPSAPDALVVARHRLGFDEVLRVQLAVGRTRKLRERTAATTVPVHEDRIRAFVTGLPFILTDDQRKAAWEIIKDMERGIPMQRLLDGDVGSGKTVVAAIAAFHAISAGHQVAIMAPTEILARQHFDSFSSFFKTTDRKVTLWTNAYKRISEKGIVTEVKGKKDTDALRTTVADGGVDIVIGTHALVQDTFAFRSLALAVVDEQHRFGVRTRQELCQKSGIEGKEPHLLSMTATPIPRSLALTVFGDLDLSLLKEKPAGRKPIITELVPPSRHEKTYATVRERIAEGRQVFVVCPLIDPSDKLGARSVTEMHAELDANVFPDAKLGVLHGKLTPDQKESVMREFAEGRIDVLVTTSVIEVGVDVPNASVMCIIGAERFGLAQLHQFRGRIGRGAHASVCYLMPTDLKGGVKERLSAVVSHADGFALAEKDLAMRGPGMLLGTEQTGFPEFRMATLTDVRLLDEARRAAKEILDADPDLDHHPALRDDLTVRVTEAHLE